MLFAGQRGHDQEDPEELEEPEEPEERLRCTGIGATRIRLAELGNEPALHLLPPWLLEALLVPSPVTNSLARLTAVAPIPPLVALVAPVALVVDWLEADTHSASEG